MANLIVEDHGPVRVLSIDCEAQMNVLSRALVAELAQHARQAAVERSLRAVVVTGVGKRAFCAGANLKERQGWTEDDVRRWLVELHTAFREIERCSKPWIAAINGLALGGGCELALGREIAENAPVAVAAAKASIDEAYDLPMDAALEMERLHYEKALLSEDRLEGLKAFAEKRLPRWSGR